MEAFTPRPVAPRDVALPLGVAAAVLAVVVVVLSRIALARDGGHFVYALDDAYIHLAMAKHFALKGVWGVTPYAFSSSSSSLLWTALLAGAFRLFGVHDAAAFVLALLSALALLTVAAVVLRRFGASVTGTGVVLVLLVFVTPFGALVFSGMEHLLQAAVVLAFAAVSAEWLVVDAAPAASRRSVLVYALAALATAVRFEGLFLIAVVAVLALFRRRVVPAATVVVAGAAPVAGYGLVSLAHGWFFLPNSVVVKGTTSALGMLFTLTLQGAGINWGAWVRLLADPFVTAPHLTFLLVAAVALLAAAPAASRGRDVRYVLLAIFAATALLHLLFAKVGWFYRYEAYLIVLGAVAVAVVLPDAWVRLRGLVPASAPVAVAASAVAALTLVASLWYSGARAVESLRETPLATSNVYEQQYQMARFLERYYEGASVALNDVGATNYYADLHCVDLLGLASLDTGRLWVEQKMSTEALRETVARHDVRVGILYDERFVPYGGVPSEWPLLAQWGVKQRASGQGGDIVSFFACRSDEATQLVRDLGAYAQELPGSVLQAGAYLPQ